MVKITTTLLRDEIRRLGNPSEVTYISKDTIGTLEISSSMEYVVIVKGVVRIGNPIVKVVINEITISTNK